MKQQDRYLRFVRWSEDDQLIQMNRMKHKISTWLCAALVFAAAVARCQTNSLGLFTDHQDVGRVHQAGSARYDAARETYFITGNGDNMWFTNDAFHFVWKKASGDLSLAASLHWPGTNGNPHRKACLLIRQTLDPDSAYADVAVHGNGLTSLQYRESAGKPTREIQSNISAPNRVRLEKRGPYVSMWLAAAADGSLQPAGGSFQIQFTEPFYVGLGVCAHDSNTIERAEFSRVELASLPPADPAWVKVQSRLEVVSIASRDRRVVYHTSDHIEAPNWSRDGQYFLFNSAGRLYKLPVAGGEPQPVDTDFAIRCNNDHGISPDGAQLAISDQTQDGKSRIYVLPASGGQPRLITELAPSYWHGWSPDGHTLAYCAERNGEFDIYSIAVEGGQEQRLTTATGLDDGPDFSPDGKFIYFNSERSGTMQIWRMKPDGADQQQVTSDQFNNWFPHPSPDGKWLVFLSYKGGVKGHPANEDVILRLMPAAGGEIQVLANLLGGQGTINVPSWSPDSHNVAFVSYQIVSP
jgi:Tol biopolymer transport system component